MKRMFAFVAAVMVVMSAALPAEAGQAPSVVFPPDSSPLGLTYPEWVGAYQVWLNEIPSPENPFVDPASPRNCEVQTSGAAFLGPFGANCSIPEGAPLVLTGAFWECSTV